MLAKSKGRQGGGWRLLRLFAILLAIPLVPLFLWWLANRFDESPSADARRYAQLAPRVVADADNAWMHFAGIGAAEGDDPVRFARLRVDALQARHAHSPVPPADAAEQALFTDPLPMARPDRARDGSDSLCQPERIDCLGWAALFRASLPRLEAENRVRLARYRAALALREWQGMYPPALDAPMPDVSIADLHRNLVARDLSLALAGDDVSALPPLLDQLADAADFWRQVAAQGGDLFTIVVASAQVHRSQLLVGDLLDRIRLPVDPAFDIPLDRLLAPLPAEIDWERALSYEYRTFERGIRNEIPGTLGVLRRCLSGEGTDSCIKQLAMDAGFAPQATFNLHAANTAALQRWLEAPARDIESARSAQAQAFEAMAPRFDGAGAILSQMSYNYVGRILAAIAVPKADYGLRLHDREAVRRMLVIKRQARQQSIPASDMPAFLAARPDALRDPYTGAPFEWDPLFRQIRFSPGVGSSSRPLSAISYRPGPIVPITACPESFEIELVDLREGSGSPLLRYVACGNGSAPIWSDARQRDDGNDPRLAADAQLLGFEAWRAHEEIGLRLRWNDGREVVRHEARLALEGDLVRGTLQPLDRGGAADFAVVVRPGSRAPLFHLRIENETAAATAGLLARASGIRVRGIERLGTGRLTLEGVHFVEDALAIAADVGNRTLRKVTPAEYVIE